MGGRGIPAPARGQEVGESLDPLRPGGPPPLSEEWFHQQKKLLKQSGIEKSSAAHAAHDVYTPSPQAQELTATPQEKFLASARSEILKMDPGAETFLPDATSRLVDSALEQEFGEEIARKPGYPQMQARITRTILEDPRYREMMEDFLQILVETERARSEGGAPRPDLHEGEASPE